VDNKDLKCKNLTIYSGGILAYGEDAASLVINKESGGKVFIFEFKTSNVEEGTLYSCRFGITAEQLKTADYKRILSNKISAYKISERHSQYIENAAEECRKVLIESEPEVGQYFLQYKYDIEYALNNQEKLHDNSFDNMIMHYSMREDKKITTSLKNLVKGECI